MKNKIYFVVMIALAAMFTIASCEKDDGGGQKVSKKFVDINNPTEVQNSIGISGKVSGDDLPEPESSPDITLSLSINSVQVNAGSSVILPYIYTFKNSLEDPQIKFVLLRVKGASIGHLQINANKVNDQQGYIEIVIPENIDDGTFSIEYMLHATSGSSKTIYYSNIVTTKIVVTNEVVSCNNARASGTSGLTFTTLHVGKDPGTVTINYNTYSVPDRIDIYQGKKWITGTATDPGTPIPPLCDCNARPLLPGFIGARDNLSFEFNPKNGENITVVVSGCLNGGTQWEWVLTEAPGCN